MHSAALLLPFLTNILDRNPPQILKLCTDSKALDYPHNATVKRLPLRSLSSFSIPSSTFPSICGVGEAIRFHLQVFFFLISVLPLFDQHLEISFGVQHNPCLVIQLTCLWNISSRSQAALYLYSEFSFQKKKKKKRK